MSCAIGWDVSQATGCEGWLTKKRNARGWWERYFVLQSGPVGPLIGWYQQPPPKDAQWQPRSFLYLAGATIERQRWPISLLHPGPTFVVVVTEERRDAPEASEVPQLCFGSDSEAVADAWLLELLAAVAAAPSGPRKRLSFPSRRGGYLSEGGWDDAARYVAQAGEAFTSVGRTAGSAVERFAVAAGTSFGCMTTMWLSLPDEREAGRKVGMVGHFIGGGLSLAAQAPGALLGAAGRKAGGATRLRFNIDCASSTRQSLALSGAEAAELLGQLLACDGCGGVPVDDVGCSRCRLRLCADCFSAHTKPPEVQVAVTRSAYEKSTLSREVNSRRLSDDKVYQNRLLDLRTELESLPLCSSSSSAPSYWGTYRSRPERAWSVCAVRDEQLMRGLQACLMTEGTYLGKGRDVKKGDAYSSLKLAAAWRLEHHDLWPRYHQAISSVRTHIGLITSSLGRSTSSDALSADKPSPLQRLNMRNEATALADSLQDWAIALGCQLDEEANEKLLGHGTKPEHLGAILAYGLNERYCGGLFGKGCYLAEDCGKCDQYSTVDDALGAHPDLHRLLYQENGLPHPGNVHYVILCRAVLGCAARTTDGNVEMSSRSGLWASDEKRELAPIPGTSPSLPYHSLLAETGGCVKRYREVMVFHSERVYPEYLLAYHRTR